MSAIPGLGIDRTAQSSELIDSNKLVNVDVPGKAEWRFEVPFRTILKLKVLEGTAEIFGTELPLNVELQLTGVKYSLYAPLEGGCKVEYQVIPNKFNLSTNEDSEIVEYISEETSMNQYINLHMVLEGLRIQASDHNLMNSNDTRTGPRVLILGNHQSGKTSLAKILSSYALKMGGSPILVNLNPQDGVFALPGSISATPISDSLDIESVNGWGGSTTSGTTLRNPKQPLIKSYGFTDYKENEDLYNYQVSRMGVAVSSRIEEDITIKNSGIIVDTPPLTIKEFDIIENIISDFEINVAVVLGNERLSIELKKRLKHRVSSGQLNILKVSKSEGVTEVDDAFLRKSQEETIKEYFNGNFRNPLSPFKTDVDLQDAIIYNGVHSVEFNASLSFLPSGDSFTPGDESSDGVKKEDSLDKYYSRVEEPSSSNLDNTIVAITQIPVTNKSEKDLLNTCVLGYAHISNVDDTRKRMKVLLPFPGAFPRNVLFATSVRYTE